MTSICHVRSIKLRTWHTPRADGYVATKLMCRLICNLPELSIRIFNPITSYFLIYRYVFRIADPYIRYSRIAYPAEH